MNTFASHRMCPLCWCQDGEKKGLSPEEVYASMRVAGNSRILPYKWLKTELPMLLDKIRMLVATSSLRSLSEKTPTEHIVSMLFLGLVKGCLIATANTSCCFDCHCQLCFPVVTGRLCSVIDQGMWSSCWRSRERGVSCGIGRHGPVVESRGQAGLAVSRERLRERSKTSSKRQTCQGDRNVFMNTFVFV